MPTPLRSVLTVCVVIAGSVGAAQAAEATPAGPADDRQQLLDRIERLEKRLADLEAGVVMSEPETRVRRKEVWVDARRC